MVRFNRRRLRPRRLGRPASPPPPPPPPAEHPLTLPEEHPGSSASTEFDVPSVLADAARPARAPSNQQDSTVELMALQPDLGPGELDIEPEPPRKLEFTCACGTRLVATPETYDKHTRCAMCQTVMLLSLVYDAERKGHEIVPFRVNPDHGP